MIFLRLHFPAKVRSYFLDTKELGTGQLSDGFTAWKRFYLRKPWCAKIQEFKGSVFVFRKIQLGVGELSLGRAQLVLRSPGHGPRSCQDWGSLLCVNLLHTGSSFYPSLQQFWRQNCPRSKQQGRPGSLWVIWGTTNVPCAVPIALQQLSPKKELAVLSSCSIFFPNKDFQP